MSAMPSSERRLRLAPIPIFVASSGVVHDTICPMRRSDSIALSMAFALVFAIPTTVSAKNNVAEFPLRVHIFQQHTTQHYHNGVPDFANGFGRANLFENGVAQGIDYSFSCSDQVMTSSGYETYPAKWKKKDEELIILEGVMGNPNATHTCTLKIQKKDFAYFMRNGNLGSEPTSAYKQWMEKHDYDPEHGKNEPTILTDPAPAKATSSSAASPNSQN